MLSAFAWQFGALDDGSEVAAILSATRGYEGGVSFYANADITSTNVGVDSFKGWGQFDVIHVVTHGVRICTDIERTICRASIAAGMLVGEVPDETDVTTGKTEAKKLKDQGVELGKAEGLTRGLEFVNLPTDIVLLTADFFQARYPGGLKDTLIFFNACETLGVEATDISDALRGSTSVFMGWTETVGSAGARAAALALYKDLSEGGYTIEFAYDRLGGLRIDPIVGSRLEIAERKAGGDLRIRDIVHLLQPGSDAVLMPGNDVVIEGERNDGEDDIVPYVVQVDGVLEGDASQVTVHVSIDGVEADPVSLSKGDVNDEDQWKIEGMFEFEYDLEEDQTSDFRAWVELHSAGETPRTTREVRSVGGLLRRAPQLGSRRSSRSWADRDDTAVEMRERHKR